VAVEGVADGGDRLDRGVRAAALCCRSGEPFGRFDATVGSWGHAETPT
jgi:hypothetical protein